MNPFVPSARMKCFSLLSNSRSILKSEKHFILAEGTKGFILQYLFRGGFWFWRIALVVEHRLVDMPNIIVSAGTFFLFLQQNYPFALVGLKLGIRPAVNP